MQQRTIHLLSGITAILAFMVFFLQLICTITGAEISNETISRLVHHEYFVVWFGMVPLCVLMISLVTFALTRQHDQQPATEEQSPNRVT